MGNETCETINLLQLEGQYLRFIVETQSEINQLTHLEKCRKCREKILKQVKNNEDSSDFGSLFQKIVEDENVPQYSDYKEPENFIDARIHWRKNKLKQVSREAELELKDLREKIRDYSG